MKQSKTKFFISILLILNILFFVIQYIFNYEYMNKFQKLNKAYSSIQQKEILIFELKDYISELEAYIFSNSIFSINNMLLKYNDNKIEKIFLKIDDILNILRKGGKINQEISVNFIGFSKFDKSLYINKEDSIFYINNIEATIELLPKFIEKIDKQILIRNNKLTEKNLSNLRYYLKLIPSIIQRTKENVNNYLISTEKQLMEIEQNKKDTLSNVFKFQLGLLFIFFMMNFFIFYLIIVDIQSINKELKKRLYYDKLTGLKNRIKLQEELKNGLLCIIDINNFGTYNELYGNKLGDEVLKKVANLLSYSEYINKDNLYRIGSDEFAIYLKEDFDIATKIQSLQDVFKKTKININNIVIENLSFKAGISNTKDLLDNASIALKIAKQENKHYHMFDVKDLTQEQEKIKEAFFWTQKIQNAIDNNLITPVFQEIVDRNRKLYKYEMLLRIKDKNKLIPPFFLPIAIKNNQYFDISKIMFSKAIEFINTKKMHLSFNINYLDITDEKMYSFYKEKISECLYPEFLTLEILESVNISNYQLLNQKLHIFRKLGVKLAIDDFGSGYSNYRHILELRPDFLKIDGSLIKDILTDENSVYIVESIRGLTKKANISIIAEFVENKDIFEKLKEMGIDYFQGYYFSKPLEI